MTLDETKHECAKWLRALALITPRDEEERRFIEDIAGGLEDEMQGNLRSPEWWDQAARRVRHHAGYASAYAYAATCDAALMMAEGRWDMVKDATIKALTMAGVSGR